MKLLKNKTILVEIVEENSFFNANISLKDSKIYYCFKTNTYGHFFHQTTLVLGFTLLWHVTCSNPIAGF